MSCCSLREQDSATTTPGSSDLRSCRQVHPAVPEDAPATRAESTSIGRTAECWFDRERQQRRVGRQGQSRTGRRSPTARGRPLRAGGRRRISTGSSPYPPRPGRLRLAGCHRRHAPLRGRDTRWGRQDRVGRPAQGQAGRAGLRGRLAGRPPERQGRAVLWSWVLLAFTRFYPQAQLRSGLRQHPGRIFEGPDASGQIRLAALVVDAI